MLDLLEIDHARFNAAKTLSTLSPSHFEHTLVGRLQVTRDRNRSDSYYNRVLGLSADTLQDLDGAIAWIAGAAGTQQTVRLDTVDTGLSQALAERGFTHAESLVWLHAPPLTSELSPGAAPTDADVRALTADDWASLRQLLTAHGPIADDIWVVKREYLCTDTFAWVGIFDSDQLVSAASTWISEGQAILGSAYTRPAWRGRGYQRQLLDHRRALATGNLLVDVQPDSTSHRNCIRAGFIELERRQVWERAATESAV